MTDGLLQLDDVALRYFVIGDGDLTITLINGYSRPASDFRMFARRLSERGIRCIFFDNRGAGETVVQGAFDLNDMVSDIHSLWNHLQIERSSVLGISMGGMIAQQFAIANRDVEKLVLVSTSPHSVINLNEEIPWSSDTERVMKKMEPYFSSTFRQKNKLLIETMVKQIAKQVETTNFVARTSLQRDALSGFDVSGRLAEIICPTLVIHGTDDGVVPLALGKEIVAGIPSATLQEFADCGHLLLAEKPKEFATAVADFLEQT